MTNLTASEAAKKRELEDLAFLLFRALRAAGPKAVVDGEPLDSSYLDEALIGGVVLDGLFDLKVAARVILDAGINDRTTSVNV